MLGKFLAGEIKQVYDVLGGCHLGYFLVKDKLLNWYDSQKYVQKHKKKCEFYNAKLKDGESLTLYCMRLEVLADLAYPNDKSKAFKKLKKHILTTMPVAFVESFAEREEIKSFIDSGKMSWENILYIA